MFDISIFYVYLCIGIVVNFGLGCCDGWWCLRRLKATTHTSQHSNPILHNTLSKGTTTQSSTSQQHNPILHNSTTQQFTILQIQYNTVVHNTPNIISIHIYLDYIDIYMFDISILYVYLCIGIVVNFGLGCCVGWWCLRSHHLFITHRAGVE